MSAINYKERVMVQEVSTQSWGSRIMGALMGTLFGFALIIGSFILIFWNESHALHTSQSLKQAQKNLINIPNSPVDPKNDLRVVYLSGVATTNEILQDLALGLSLKAIKLDRTVRMYQWQQNTETRTEKQLGGSEKEIKTYTYKPVWSGQVINSEEFKDPTNHQNPTEMPIKSQHQQAQTVTVGDFYLPQDLVSQIAGATLIDLSQVDKSVLQEKFNKPVLVNGTDLYVGADPQSPTIGDLKIQLTEVLPQTVSIIAQQTENTLQPYLAPAGESVSLLNMGQVSPQQMIQEAVSANKTTMWLLRLASLIMMVFGISLLLRPLVILADVVPFIGSMMGLGTGLIALTGGLVLWSVAIAIAWFTVRPLWGLGLIIIVVGICYLLIKSRKKRSSL